MRIEAGRFRGRSLPRPRGARPVGGRLKSSLFGVLAGRLEGARVLDLCAGVGGLGLEALSRGAASVVLIEKDARQADALRHWLEEVGASDTEACVLRRDALGGPVPGGPFDLVFLDPPFPFWADDRARTLLALATGVLAPGGVVAAKLPAREALPEDPAWTLRRRRTMGSVAWALVGSVEKEGGEA